MSVFQNLDCLSLVVCSNTTLLKLQTVLFLLFSKFCASKSGVRLIYGCGLYTADPNMVVFGNTQKLEGGLKFFISNFPSLSVRIVLNLHNEKKG